MGEDVEKLKQRRPLLDYLRQQNWEASPACHGSSEFFGLCPLHQETQPSFYVNARKNLFYCHGCGQGGDLIRFVELSHHLSFRQSLAYLEQQSPPAVDSAAVLEEAVAFYQEQLDCYPEARRYLKQRGVCDPALIQKLRIGYAPGGSLRRHLTAQGYSFDLPRHRPATEKCDGEREVPRAEWVDFENRSHTGNAPELRGAVEVPRRIQNQPRNRPIPVRCPSKGIQQRLHSVRIHLDTTPLREPARTPANSVVP